MQEFEFIKRCTEALPAQAESLLCGIGDDCAVITGSGGRDWLISTDAYAEGIHFCRDWMTAKEIGYRCLTGAVSDIAAMGGRPRYVTIAISVPPVLDTDYATQVMAGLAAAAAHYQMVIIGGDTTSSCHDLHISLTVMGDIRHGVALYRRGARVGDVVYVTGDLGGAQMGLKTLQSGQNNSAAVNRFVHPHARVASGQWINDTGCVTSMIDVSDGLVQDLGHVAHASGVGIEIQAETVPCWRRDDFIADIETSCTSGEEYELAFTIDGRRDAAFQRLLPAVLGQLGHPITRIGRVVAGHGVVVRDASGADLTPPLGGYRHRIGKDA
jgi:thiamine-monophosphate kinase